MAKFSWGQKSTYRQGEIATGEQCCRKLSHITLAKIKAVYIETGKSQQSLRLLLTAGENSVRQRLSYVHP